jgi:hypothetical protein
MSSVLNQIAIELDNYPADEVALSFINVNPPGAVINVGEVVPFQVRIENNGHINMTGVTLHVHGDNGTLVATTATGPFTSVVSVAGLTVNGGGSRDTGVLYFKAPSSTRPAGTDLLSTHVEEWFGNFDHYFTNHTNNAAVPANGHYENSVNAS